MTLSSLGREAATAGETTYSRLNRWLICKIMELRFYRDALRTRRAR